MDSGFYKENILDNLENKEGIAVENTINKVKFENPVVKILDTEFKFEINEEFYPSDIVYIDAKSGAGKSTLLRSLLNIRDVDGIFINEKEVNSLSLDELREKVAYVPHKSTHHSCKFEGKYFGGYSQRQIYRWKNIVNGCFEACIEE